MFTGHFPDFPVMPGVLIIEAMAQTAGVLVLKSIPDRHNKLVLLVAVENARFRKPVVPGDTLRMEMKVLKRKATRRQDGRRGHGGWRGGGRGRSDVQAGGQGTRSRPQPSVVAMPIHPTAIVDPRARIAESAEIGPYCDHRARKWKSARARA